MSDAHRFDELYAESRGRLLTQAFALTGDLTAARGAVRAGFVAAWHHWRRVRTLDDADTWLRPYVHSHAQRRHIARIRHRDKVADPEVAATLDALAKLPPLSRKALVLTQLSQASREQMAREVGLPLEEAERRLQTATTQFSLQREVPTTAMRPVLEQLSVHCADQRWPRAPIVRRSGTARRRGHLLAGAALVVAAVVGTGLVVTDTDGVHPSLAQAHERLTSVGHGRPSPSAATGSSYDGTLPQVAAGDLLTVGQVRRASPGHHWRTRSTGRPTGDSLPCQGRRLADRKATTSLVRTFAAGRGKAAVGAVQTMEESASRQAARAGYREATGWFAGCDLTRTQLLSVRQVAGLGDGATQFALQQWDRPQATLVVGLARTGRLTTVTVTRSGGSARPDLTANLRLLTSAVDDLCHVAGGGACSSLPEPSFVAAPRFGKRPAMLDVLDLPPVAGVDRPWVGTTPRRATKNLAATRCDRSSFEGVFRGARWRHDSTRTFLVPGAGLSTTFGLTETVGRLPEQRAAAFLGQVRARLASCADRVIGTKVHRLATGPDLAVWRVATKVTDKETVTFYMGVVRSGGAVAQVGFVADGNHTVEPASLVSLVRRAGERVTALKP